MAEVWVKVAGAAVSLYSAKKGADAAKKAGKQAADAADKQAEVYRYIYDDQRALNMPAYNDGNTARAQYMRMLGLTPSDVSVPQAHAPPATYDPEAAYLKANPDVARDPYYGTRPYEHYMRFGQGEGRSWGVEAAPAQQQSQTQQKAQEPVDLAQMYDQWRETPGYQFGLQEGTKAIESSAAARGGLNSGATLKALQRYGINYADQQGFAPYMNRLAGLFGGAQVAASNIGNAGNQFAAGTANAMQNAANTRAQSTYDSANAWQQGIETVWKYGNQLGQEKGWW